MGMSRFVLRVADRIVPIPGSAEIGRHASSTVRLADDPSVSRHHARVRVVSENGTDAPWVEDLGSYNGTYVNGRRITQLTRVRHGDRIAVGGYVLIVQDSSRERFKTPAIRSVPPPSLLPDSETQTLRAPPGEAGPAHWIRALAIVDISEREVQVSTLLEQTLERIARGETPSRDTLSVATEALIQLATQTNDPVWLRELDQLHRLCAHRPDDSVIKRIDALVDSLSND